MFILSEKIKFSLAQSLNVNKCREQEMHHIKSNNLDLLKCVHVKMGFMWHLHKIIAHVLKLEPWTNAKSCLMTEIHFMEM